MVLASPGNARDMPRQVFGLNLLFTAPAAQAAWGHHVTSLTGSPFSWEPHLETGCSPNTRSLELKP